MLPFESDETVAQSSCLHVFHHDCLQTWFLAIAKRQLRVHADATMQLDCPTCRQNFAGSVNNTEDKVSDASTVDIEVGTDEVTV